MENLKLYNLLMNHLFGFSLSEIAETVYCVPHSMNIHGYRHDRLGKVVRFSISVSQMKDLVESRPNPKYQVVSFCCSEINSINIDFLPSFPS